MRITLPERPPVQPQTGNPETVRIELPKRPPPAGAESKISPAKPPTFRPPSVPTLTPKPPTAGLAPQIPKPANLPPPPTITSRPRPPADRAAAAAPPGTYPNSSVQAGPKKETARIAILPTAASGRPPTVNMTKTQPLRVTPPTSAPSLPVAINTASEPAAADSIPRTLCWAVLGISILTLLIQIWNYFSA